MGGAALAVMPVMLPSHHTVRESWRYKRGEKNQRETGDHYPASQSFEYPHLHG